MIQPADFPYIQAIHIKDAYAVKDRHITVFDGERFRHLILTGKNGSGKTTVLRSIVERINAYHFQGPDQRVLDLEGIMKANPGHVSQPAWRTEMTELTRVGLTCSGIGEYAVKGVFSFFPATRQSNVEPVERPLKEEETVAQKQAGKTANLSASFTQYLVNKKFIRPLIR